MVNHEEAIRLQKILAQAGVASRRDCENLISQGRVTVNGAVVRELGSRALQSDQIEVDGVPVLTQDKVVYAFNKPRGIVSAMEDESLPNLGDFCQKIEVRLFHVGRLDVDSEGLILLTNDGDLAQRISHPKFETSKTYQLEIQGKVTASEKKQLMLGIELEDGLAHLDSFKVKAESLETSLIEVRIHSGKNRILRRMFESIGHPVNRLIRTKIGDLNIDNLKPGKLKKLSQTEVAKIFEEVFIDK
jgi:23S rRNA pseudouridine2605 synthase